MAYKAHGIVVGVKNWGEADKRVSFFTEERGRIPALAFGCRRPKSPLAAPLQLFFVLELDLVAGKRMDTVRQAQIITRPKKMMEDLNVMAYAAFVAEFVRDFLPEGIPEPMVYKLLLRVMEAFERRNPRITAIAAVWQLLEFTGMQLAIERCARCAKRLEGEARFHEGAGGAVCMTCASRLGVTKPLPASLRALIISLRDFDWKEETKLRITGKDLIEAEQMLICHIEHLLGHSMHALHFIRQLS